MSATVVPDISNTARPQAPRAGEERRSARSETNQWSWPSAPACTNTQRSSGTPADLAASTEHTIRAAAWSVWMLAFMSFRYGNPIILLSAEAVRISSGVRATGDQAAGLCEATSEKRDHRREIFSWCWPTDSAAAALMAFSNTG